MRPLLRALAALPLLAAAAAAQPAKFHAASPTAPLSQVVEVGNTIYLSGMLGTAAGGQLAPGGIAAETRQTLENVKAALARVNATMADVVKCTVFLVDVAEWDAMNAVYVTYFPTNKPARSAIGVAGLVRNARVEIECLAVRGAGGG
ncbi:RidA family protein [Roseisolibacter sp. H3M3-2]|uniref:RidA family protein n=1 Tax=Roseisolibacter sp. H3M3-2 TaxID=3031323 RepID=UPI0023DAECA3|nr:RidA family protein [Roseisolibacter sp. H3M3-2]MDF1503903.1 RidA family protein [Roseisolibacter sp. H3M3-2]